MATTLLIVKNAGVEGNWSHFFSTLGELEESRFYVTIFNGMFQIKEENGGVIEAVLFSNITIRDDSSGGTLYVITSIPQLQALLIALKYPAYVPLVNVNVLNLISADLGNIITIGSDGLLYATASSGGTGGVLNTQVFSWTDTDPQTFTITTGWSPKQVILSGQYLRKALWTVAGQVVTILQTMYDGDDVEILIQQN